MSLPKIHAVPEILRIPPKLLPIIPGVNQHKIMLIEGGRGSAKTQSVARLILTIAEQRVVRIVCGRETQNTIADSVYTVLADLIRDYNLSGFTVLANEIRHRNGSNIMFRGFREQGSINIKGMEGVDLAWIDEAQAISRRTLDALLPTLRKENSRFIFTYNRFMRDDPVHETFFGRPDVLHIKINYYDNPYCPLTLKDEAEICRNRSQKEYAHIWEGEPLQQADDYLFNHDKLHAAFHVQPYGELYMRQRVLGIDFAAQGNDLCVATVLDRMSTEHWSLADRIAWDEPDTMVSVGKIVNLIGELKPNVTIMDVGGMGKPVYDRLIEVGMTIIPFDGGSTAGVDTNHYRNVRAAAYFRLREWFESKFLCIGEPHREVIRQLEKIRFKYLSNGVRQIQSKIDMKKDLGHSPDDADSLMMAVWGACTALNSSSNTIIGRDHGAQVVRKSSSRSRRRA